MQEAEMHYQMQILHIYKNLCYTLLISINFKQGKKC